MAKRLDPRALCRRRLVLFARELTRPEDLNLVARLALGLMQAPDVAMAIAGNPSDAGTAMLEVDLADAWRRNWTDYASLQAAAG